MLEITSIGYIILLIEIMIVSGALGGMVSALLSWRDDQSFLGLIIKHTLTGIVMAMTVPLILNMFSSDLLDASRKFAEVDLNVKRSIIRKFIKVKFLKEKNCPAGKKKA